MKLGQVLLLNVVIVAAALLLYDQLRGEGPAPGRTRPRTEATTGLEQRVQALEAVRREPRPEAVPSTEAPAEPAALPEEATPTEIEPVPAAEAAPGPITAAEIRRFRDLREAVQRADRIERNRKRVDDALDKLPFRLTKRQRERIHTAVADFEPRIDEIWIEAKTEARRTVDAGGKVDRQQIVTTVGEIIQKAFAETITDVVDRPADAETVAQTLMPGGKW